ncbi:hypothetical protein NL676_008761 [Syzygium grande]|nr:hypothetical protein NL676_008761 [Syzygium grande]
MRGRASEQMGSSYGKARRERIELSRRLRDSKACRNFTKKPAGKTQTQQSSDATAQDIGISFLGGVDLPNAPQGLLPRSLGVRWARTRRMLCCTHPRSLWRLALSDWHASKESRAD